MSPPARRVRGIVALASLGLGALAGGAYAQQPGGPLEGGSPRGTVTIGPQRRPVDLLASADDITRQVVALRGLVGKRGVDKAIVSRQTLLEKLRARIAVDYTEAELRLEGRVLKRLGLLPEGVDYEALLSALLMEQAAGYYDPTARKLYIADWVAPDRQRLTLAHEIEHALQDQHFDLRAFAAPMKEEGDRQLARAALVEGDAVALMLEFAVQQEGEDITQLPSMDIDKLSSRLSSAAQATPEFSRSPRFLRETLLFPYTAGLAFVLRLRREGPWSRIDEAFRHPPESSEQVLHPQKYLRKEKPVLVTSAPLPSLAPRKELRRDVFGELVFRLLFATQSADGPAERAAEGWGGDRNAVYGVANDESTPVVVVSLSTWDTEEDAIEAEAALALVVTRQAGRGDADPGVRPTVVENGELAWSVERRGQNVLALFGAPRSGRAQVAEEAWRDWKVAARPESREKPGPAGPPVRTGPTPPPKPAKPAAATSQPAAKPAVGKPSPAATPKPAPAKPAPPPARPAATPPAKPAPAKR